MSFMKGDPMTPDPKDEFRAAALKAIYAAAARYPSAPGTVWQELADKLTALHSEKVAGLESDREGLYKTLATERDSNRYLSQRVAHLEAQPQAVFGFYEEKYPTYTSTWENELQSPVTVDECNVFVERIRKREAEIERLSSELERAKEEQRLSRSVHDPAKCEECTHVGYENTIKDLKAELEQAKKERDEAYTSLIAERDTRRDVSEVQRDRLASQVNRLREAAYKQISKAEACHNDSTFQDGMKHAAEEILKALQTLTPEPRKPAPYHPYMSCCQSAEIHESTGCMAYSTPEPPAATPAPKVSCRYVIFGDGYVDDFCGHAVPCPAHGAATEEKR